MFPDMLTKRLNLQRNEYLLPGNTAPHRIFYRKAKLFVLLMNTDASQAKIVLVLKRGADVI